jgi:pSer/pThr/pTyr-binding forkhead associated (FHA) protein
MPTLRSTISGETVAFELRLRVGRAEDSDLRIDQGTVSTDHAILELRDGGLFVRDLGSTNGTRVRGRRILGWTRLAPGDVVRFGPDAAWEVTADAGDEPAAVHPRSTVREGSPEGMADLSLHLVHERPGDGSIELDLGGDAATFDGVPNRFVLMLVLARARVAAAADEADADPEGWVDDERLRVSLWGKIGAASRFNAALTKLIYDTRRMIASRGLDPSFIEKSRGRTRLRLDAARITIEEG